MPDTLIRQVRHGPGLQDIAARLPARYPFLLDSAASGPLGAHSLLLRQAGEVLTLHPDGSLEGPGEGRGFLERFRSWYRRLALAEPDQANLPFAGGWFVYLGYELAGEIEPVLELPPAQDPLPVAFAARCDGAVLVRNDAPDRAMLVAETEQVMRSMQEELSSVRPLQESAPPCVQGLAADPPAEFEAAINRIQQYLAEGDVFQVNISRGWRGRFREAPVATALYRRLRERNPAPFAGLLNWHGVALLSSSPERLVEVRGDRVQTRPIAGTYPRGADRGTDAALSRDLQVHPKERAEHVMLIDLERNDLGRVCRAGSVEVNELMVVESYPHVHHMVSNVRGLLRHGQTPADVLRAVFPGGTITGCPKVRCMQIIAELEGAGRGFYTGSMGYVSRNGNMDMNILIRSMLLDGADVAFRTGAGIVADSVATLEVAETEAKARGLIDTLECSDA